MKGNGEERLYEEKGKINQEMEGCRQMSRKAAENTRIKGIRWNEYSVKQETLDRHRSVKYLKQMKRPLRKPTNRKEIESNLKTDLNLPQRKTSFGNKSQALPKRKTLRANRCACKKRVKSDPAKEGKEKVREETTSDQPTEKEYSKMRDETRTLSRVL